jgi:acyl dehydratase
VTLVLNGPQQVLAFRGKELAPTSWLEIDQARVTAFADCTLDPQWIHVDERRAAAGPFGTTIAHGFLTLSLIPYFWQEAVRLEGFRMTINYGLNRVRFPAPVPVGSRLRARFSIADVSRLDDALQLQNNVLIERESHDKPVCVAEMIIRLSI